MEDRDEQEESDEVHRSRQHPQTLGTAGVREREVRSHNDHMTVGLTFTHKWQLKCITVNAQ